MTDSCAQKLVPIREAARILGVPPNTVRRWADRGLIAFERRPSGHRVFDVEKMKQVQGHGGDLDRRGAIAIVMRRRGLSQMTECLSRSSENPGRIHQLHYHAVTATHAVGTLVQSIGSGELGRIFIRDLASWQTVDPSGALMDLCRTHQVSVIFCH